MRHEAEVRGREDGMGIRREDYRTFPTIGEAITWVICQRKFGYSRGWINDIEVDIVTGRIVYPERVNEKTLREFDFAWREMKAKAA
jgi:hypothetical protein